MDEWFKKTASFVADVATSGPRTLINIGTNLIDDPTQAWKNPEGTFIEPVLHHNPLIQATVDVAVKATSQGEYRDLHSKRYGPFEDRSDWMGRDFEHIKDKCLQKLSLPATHDSGTYDLSVRDSDEAEDIVKQLAGWSITASQIMAWATAQYLDFGGQLNLGIRAFDLRVGVSGHDGSLRIFHSLESNQTLNDMIAPMGIWLANHKGEVIIFNVDRAMNFKGHLEKYKELLKVFKDAFGEMLAPYSYFEEQKPFQDYISSNKRAIVIFEPNSDINPEVPAQADIPPPDWVWRQLKCLPSSPTDEQKGKVLLKYGDLGISRDKPQNFSQGVDFASTTLMKISAIDHHPKALQALKDKNLYGVGGLYQMDFPEIPDKGLVDYILELNRPK